ncbi:MAG: hypothetical protein GX660_14280 [Clostridiaceae bacterium]|nr:hypothetical protein [Clostridiaceae bacterium]
MNSYFRLPGFPPPEKQGIVKFYILKNLSYSSRMAAYMLLLVIGFFFQVYFLSISPGIFFLLFATLLNLVKGYDSRARLNSFSTDHNWTEVKIEQIYEIEKLDDKMTKWDKDMLDITNSLGVAIFLLILAGLFFGSIFLAIFTSSSVAKILAVDVAILVLPLWFNGTRRILKQNNLRIKVDIVAKMYQFFTAIKKEGENFKPSIMLARDNTGKSIPKDIRFAITFDNMPDGFYGVQAQINLNMVQGTSYPYFYCVIPAKLGFGLEQFVYKIAKTKNVTIECQKSNDTEVLVIRQFTTNTSGYHTKINDCKNILEITLKGLRTILGS